MSMIDDTLQKIDGIVENYHEWTVGITADPKACRQKQGCPGEWHCWDAEIPHVAHVIESHLVARGMRTGMVWGGMPRFLYIYRSATADKSPSPSPELTDTTARRARAI